jgi:4a-hydroxytetrahydrobiopterin dehydratase
MGKVNQIGELAEADGHHPDLHITGYRKLKIDLTTHAIGGLSENDFILAAKIDELLD